MPTPDPLARPLEAALAAARAAAALLDEAWRSREPLHVDSKGCHDYVTQVDRRSEPPRRPGLSRWPRVWACR